MEAGGLVKTTYLIFAQVPQIYQDTIKANLYQYFTDNIVSQGSVRAYALERHALHRIAKLAQETDSLCYCVKVDLNKQVDPLKLRCRVGIADIAAFKEYRCIYHVAASLTASLPRILSQPTVVTRLAVAADSFDSDYAKKDELPSVRNAKIVSPDASLPLRAAHALIAEAREVVVEDTKPFFRGLIAMPMPGKLPPLPTSVLFP